MYYIQFMDMNPKVSFLLESVISEMATKVDCNQDTILLFSQPLLVMVYQMARKVKICVLVMQKSIMSFIN
jgi:hypothetical protein